MCIYFLLTGKMLLLLIVWLFYEYKVNLEEQHVPPPNRINLDASLKHPLLRYCHCIYSQKKWFRSFMNTGVLSLEHNNEIDKRDEYGESNTFPSQTDGGEGAEQVLGHSPPLSN